MADSCSASFRTCFMPYAFFVAVSLLSFGVWGNVAAQTMIEGVPYIRDADTIAIGTTVIRLYGIDAPEGNQTCSRAGSSYLCGQEATEALRALIATQTDPTVRCDHRGLDRYDRVLSECFLGSINLNAWLVEQGYALAYRQYSDRYVDDEAVAAAAGQGLWAGEFVPPWDYRRTGQEVASTDVATTGQLQGQTQTVVSDPPNTASNTCDIKGNINREGERIYHTLASPWYERTIIDLSQGERWFCSEAEAQAAGWRRAGQR